MQIVSAFLFGLLFVVGTVLLGRTSAFFGVSSLNQETVAQTLEDAQGRTVSLRVGGNSSAGEAVEFAASGTVITFRGFLAAYEEGRDEKRGDLFVIPGMSRPIAMGLVAAAGKPPEQLRLDTDTEAA